MSDLCLANITQPKFGKDCIISFPEVAHKFDIFYQNKVPFKLY